MNTVLDTPLKTRDFTKSWSSARLQVAFNRWWRTYAERRAQRLAAARLRSLSESQLKDIGISRGQIEFAVRGMDGWRQWHTHKR